MTKDDSVQIHYGWHGVREGGAEAPDARIPIHSDSRFRDLKTVVPC